MLAALLLVWVALGPPIQRPSEGVPLTWDAPASCPDLGRVREGVERFAPGILDTRDASATKFDVHVEARVHGYGATIVVTNLAGQRERELEAATCEVVADAVALMIAVALDPVASATSLRTHTRALGQPTEPELAAAAELELSEPELAPAPEPEASSEDTEPVTSAVLAIDDGRDDRDPAERRASTLRVGLGVFGSGAYGPTNTGYGGVHGRLALLGARWRVELSGGWSIPRRVRRGADPSGVPIGGVFDGWTVTGRGCFVPSRGRLEFPLCPGVELGAVRGRGVPELPVVLDASFPWVALGLGQGLLFAPIERLALGVELNVVVPLARGKFSIEGAEVQRIAPVAVRGLLGVELRLP